MTFTQPKDISPRFFEMPGSRLGFLAFSMSPKAWSVAAMSIFTKEGRVGNSHRISLTSFPDEHLPPNLFLHKSVFLNRIGHSHAMRT